MRFAIKKYVQLGLWCAISSAALAAPLPSDPVFIESEGCVQSPLPHAPKEAFTIHASTIAGKDLVGVRVWFQPCTVPNATLAYKSVLLMELPEESGINIGIPPPDQFRDIAEINRPAPAFGRPPDQFRNIAAIYFNLLENSQKINMAFFSNAGRVMPGADLNYQRPLTFLIKKEVNQSTFNLNSSLIKLDKPNNSELVITVGLPVPSVIDFSIPTTSGLDSPIPLDNFTGPWWNTEEGGHGLVVSQDSANYLWLTWYSYDDQSEPLWYVSESTNIWTASK